MIVATGFPEARTLFTGGTNRSEGIVPKEHFNLAPAVTRRGIRISCPIENDGYISCLAHLWTHEQPAYAIRLISQSTF